jgi:hypothetical protein
VAAGGQQGLQAVAAHAVDEREAENVGHVRAEVHARVHASAQLREQSDKRIRVIKRRTVLEHELNHARAVGLGQMQIELNKQTARVRLVGQQNQRHFTLCYYDKSESWQRCVGKFEIDRDARRGLG